MLLLLWIAGIVILIFIILFIISLFIKDEDLEKSKVGRAIKFAKNCCLRRVQRKKFDEYNFK